MSSSTTGEKVIDILLRDHLIDPDTLMEAQEEADSTGTRMEKVLVERGVVPATAVALALSEYLKIPPMELTHFSPQSAVMDMIPKETMTRHMMVPICRTGRMLTVAMGDPFDLTGLEEVQSITGMEIVPVVAPEKQVSELLQKLSQQQTAGLEDILRDVEETDLELGSIEAEEVSLDEMLEGAEDAPVIRIVNSILVEALSKRVSDIHIEPMEKSIRLRYRIDGVLYENPSPPKPMQNAITSRLKIMSNLDIAERRIPQDGRFKIRAMGKECDVRMSMLPTVHGEKIVMRILDKTNLAPSVDALGLDETDYEKLMYALSQPHGLLLVTGPTGSGKTTTLYSGLQELNTAGVNIITTEDPVEYQLSGINQVQIHDDVGLSFAAALRSILRQDPDIVMVGEMRDGETASIGIQAALTGHLVLSTLHTNDAPGAVARMSYMGIEPFMLSSSLLLTQAQRLYRRLCPACKKPRDVPEEALKKNHIPPELLEGADFYSPKGCPKCADTGYRGRGAVMEIMLLNDDIRETILKDTTASVIRDAAIRSGMTTLRDVGLKRVVDGVTTIEEIIRVTTGH